MSSLMASKDIHVNTIKRKKRKEKSSFHPFCRQAPSFGVAASAGDRAVGRWAVDAEEGPASLEIT